MHLNNKLSMYKKINVSHLSFTQHLYDRRPSVPLLVSLAGKAGVPTMVTL